MDLLATQLGKPVHSISACTSHSALSTGAGEVFVFGEGGPVGMLPRLLFLSMCVCALRGSPEAGLKPGKHPSPLLYPLRDVFVVQVSCGAYHTAALSGMSLSLSFFSVHLLFFLFN
jgi:hypothetical protein